MSAPTQEANKPVPAKPRTAAKSTLALLVNDAIADLVLAQNPRDDLFTDWGSGDPYHVKVGRGECAS